MMLEIPQLETLNLSDGTSLTLSKTPGVSADEWSHTKKFLEENPEEARRWEVFCKDAKQVRTWMCHEALSSYYQDKLNSGNEAVTLRFLGLEKNPDFAHVFEDVRRGGAQAALQHTHNEPMMIKVSRAVGGISEEVKATIDKIYANPLTLQEACKMGKLSAVQDYIKTTEANGKMDLEAKDAKGITCLGHAVGANRIAVVQLLLEKKANAHACDASGGNALHYAAAYGRKDLLDCLLKGDLDINKKTTQGQTPLALATRNKMKDAIELLKAKGGGL
mmetsp:Transcript_89361/g.208022  ORF Transcript_89361/g.208022 Transcript_89361/m.208022 type:complete len:276 (+) Transcript_89361:56-883(+)